MMTLRAYTPEDSRTICGWVQDSTSLFQWSADRIGTFPLSGNELNEHYAAREDDFFPLTAVDENGTVAGHLLIRIPDMNDKTTVRFGFVILSPSLRGHGNGKRLLRLAIDYARETLNATKITLGVFQNNPAAMHCYEAVGFKPVGKTAERIAGEEWTCIEMALDIKAAQ